MQELIALLLGFIVTLTGEWPGVCAASYQGGCHSSATSERPAAASSKGAPMSPVDIDDIRKQFNASSQKVRIVALLSPTCGGCKSGHATIANILGKFSSPRLQAILVWEGVQSVRND